MGGIVALGLAAAVYPQLLAVVVVILTRPSPRPLLWACYLASLVVSVAASTAILAVFSSRERLLGTSSTSLGPSAYLVIGVLALGLAILAGTPRGRELLGRDRSWARWRPARPDREPGRSPVVKARAEQALREGSLLVAGAVGVILGVPGPFDLLAMGRLAQGDYAHLARVGLLVLFSLLKLLLIEVPIVFYAVRPQGTAAAVERFADWMRANKLQVVAGVVAVIGVVLVVRGLAGLG